MRVTALWFLLAAVWPAVDHLCLVDAGCAAMKKHNCKPSDGCFWNRHSCYEYEDVGKGHWKKEVKLYLKEMRHRKGKDGAPTVGEWAVPAEWATIEPTELPTSSPNAEPTEKPTERPTPGPNSDPTEKPTGWPTEMPTCVPTGVPTEKPTGWPTEMPTWAPTEVPTEKPTGWPTEMPTGSPVEPTGVPTEMPTWSPTQEVTEEVAEVPTELPTGSPIAESYVHTACTAMKEHNCRKFEGCFWQDGGCVRDCTAVKKKKGHPKDYCRADDGCVWEDRRCVRANCWKMKKHKCKKSFACEWVKLAGWKKHACRPNWLR